MYGYTFCPRTSSSTSRPRARRSIRFKTKDGWLTIAPFTDAQSKRLRRGVGHPEWWPEVADRTERGRGIMRGLAKTLPEKNDRRMARSAREGRHASAARSTITKRCCTDRRIVENESFTVYDHPDAGTVRTVNPGARFSETPAKMWRTPPQPRRAHRRSPARTRNRAIDDRGVAHLQGHQ